MKKILTILLACMMLVGGVEPTMAAQQSSKSSSTMSAAARKKAAAKKKAAKKKAAQQKKKEKEQQKKAAKGSITIHNIGFNVGAGYSGLVNKYEQNKFIGGGGGLLGVNYELQHKALLFNVGPELRLFSSKDKLLLDKPFDADFLYKDADFTGTMTKHYQFDRLSENQVVGQLMLPVMIGAQFWENHLYALAGVKVGYTILKNYKQTGVVTSSVTDKMAVEDWYNLTGHGMTTYDYPEKGADYGHGKNPFGLDLTISAEFGVNIGSFLGREWEEENNKRSKPLHFRVAAFLDYGVMNLACASAGPIAMPHYEYIETNSIHQSDLATSRLNSLLVGVKGTLLLQMNKPKPAKKPNPYMSAGVWEAETMRPIPGVTIDIRNEATGRVNRKPTNSKGMFSQRMAPGEYSLSIAEKNTPAAYLPTTQVSHVSHDELNTDTIIFTLQRRPEPQPEEPVVPIVKPRVWILNNLLFATAQATILPESEGALQELYDYLSTNPTARIRIVGHTDNIGSERDNQILSENRAASVKAAMVERGIDADRIETEGRGESQPIDTNDTEEGRARNRRVEIVRLD